MSFAPDNPCVAFFDANRDNKDKVKALHKVPERHGWEKLTASMFSPGPVQDEEQILRIGYAPNMVDADGKLTPLGLQDVMNKGFSTDRRSYADEAEVWNRGVASAAAWNELNPLKPQRSVKTLHMAPVDQTRALRCPADAQAFGVYDTGLEKNSAHADVCLLSEDKAARHQLVFDLRDTFVPVKVADEPLS